MSNEISKLIDPNNSDRPASLKAWLVYHGVPMHKLASAIGVHPSMVSRIIRGDRAPARRIQQLIELGVPEELLPVPSPPPGRPPGKTNAMAKKKQDAASSSKQALSQPVKHETLPAESDEK